MSVAQSDFAAALLDPARAVPEGLSDPAGRPAGKRFAVYRNNVVASLTEALATAFPVLQKLLGEANFRGLAGLFVRRHPPSSPRLMFYGEAMPGFLEGFQPLVHIPYLADVARLELALRESYHAADAEPIDPAALQALDAEALMAARLRLAPAVRLVRSRWPLHAIWAYNMAGGPKPAPVAEDVLVTRPGFDPAPHALTPAGGAFTAALLAGGTLGAAAEAGAEKDPAFDLSAPLGALLAGGAIVALDTETER
jgi:Uncharacterized protein conserved in bacteria